MTTDQSLDPSAAVMNTVSGEEFRPFDPRPADVSLSDVAHGLSHICRCSGQTREFYSVGLHSLYVSRDLRERGADERVQLYGLLHDAPEAYVSDLVSPVKRHLDCYRDLEDGILSAVWDAFALPEPTDAEWQRVHESDVRLRRYEMDTLLPEIVDGEVPDLGYDLHADGERDVAAAFEARAEELVAGTTASLP
ncbi:hypothetical protein [Haloarcula litorea]|uniref:hypothetical protein n=1 Tax=Haloarcula litorea TaxID=3032579 RepID=UPI0023E7F850|nr:hypothetical protein [Halomicroarcula sp. GDY20]